MNGSGSCSAGSGGVRVGGLQPLRLPRWDNNAVRLPGRLLDAGGLALPGATITVTEQNTGFTGTVVTAETGVYHPQPRTRDLHVDCGDARLRRAETGRTSPLTAGSTVTSNSRCKWGACRNRSW